MKQICKFMIFLLVSGAMLCAQDMTQWIIDVRVPETTPEDAEIFVAGNFNMWNPADPAYKLIRVKPGIYTKVFNIFIDEIEFKFTMGSWNDVEVLLNGENRGNRQEKLKRDFVKKIYEIQMWHEHEKIENISGDVRIIENFEMPQLKRNRRIWIYLPPGYEASEECYPVLYMHDGQNLFNDATSFSGEWGVDETLERLISSRKINKLIVVGIENHPEYRLNEYSPYLFEYSGLKIRPQASEYADFIVETLKPFIDGNYRTKPSREHTAIAGSSMGGLVSVYIGVKYQSVFSKVGALSSSFGVCKSDLVKFINEHPKEYPMRFWLDMGSKEMGNMDLNEYQIPIKNALIDAGWQKRKEVKFLIFQGAEHNETYWRNRFDKVLKYLFK
ncbi:MAG: alpha/beta hydrolase-fold protein [Candidatus Marinimicrobia bacterium]|nr:alpha/beta hydrolase-fold protein [Candidatus Neomarinimicrobiota bacterium]